MKFFVPRSKEEMEEDNSSEHERLEERMAALFAVPRVSVAIWDGDETPAMKGKGDGKGAVAFDGWRPSGGAIRQWLPQRTPSVEDVGARSPGADVQGPRHGVAAGGRHAAFGSSAHAPSAPAPQEQGLPRGSVVPVART